MAEWSSFFNSYKGDRKYTAAQFVEYFANFIGNGVFTGGSYLKVEAAGGNMDITVQEGKGWINGYYYINRDAPKTLSLYESELTKPRIDRVVLRLDLSQETRWIQAVVKTGTPADNPNAPALQRDNAAWELGLADIRVNANAKEILQSNITDLRLNADMCGVVAALIKQPDLTEIFNQYQDYMNRKMNQWDSTYDDYVKTIGGWYASVKNDIAKLQSFDFDNLAALAEVTRTTTFSGDVINETLKNTINGQAIAVRTTAFNDDDTTSESVVVYAEDGITVMKESVKKTIFNPDGSVSEIVKGWDDYSFAAAYADRMALAASSYANPRFPEVLTVNEALDTVLQLSEEISWKNAD